MFYIERLIGYWIKVIEIEEDRRVVVQRCGVWLLKATVCGFDSCVGKMDISFLFYPLQQLGKTRHWFLPHKASKRRKVENGMS